MPAKLFALFVAMYATDGGAVIDARHWGIYETRTQCEAEGRDFERRHATQKVTVRWSCLGR